MLVVVADVEHDAVKWAVVRVRLVSLLEDVVLRDEVSGDRVEPHCEERPSAEVQQRSEPERVVDGDVECYLHDQV